jgi:RNA polymerase sigma-B factor
VVGEIKRHFRDKAWTIRVPRHLQELNGRMSRTVEALTASLGRSPTIADLSGELGESPEAVLEAIEAGGAYSPMSLSVGPTADGELDPMEMIGGEDLNFERTEARASLEPVLGELPDRERLILQMRFEDGLTQTQIADRVGISQMHVSRLIRKSLEQIRREIDSP